MLEIDTATPIPLELADRLHAMPKADSHIHVEGATDAEMFYQMARRNRVELPTDSFEEAYWSWHSL